jgi:hypothetical protein
MKVVMCFKPDKQSREVAAVLMDSIIMQVRVEDPGTWSCDWSEDSGWNGPKLMYMAGLFDEWMSSEVCVNLFCMFWGFHVNCYANHGSYRVIFWVLVPCSVLVYFYISREQSASSFQVSELHIWWKRMCQLCRGSFWGNYHCNTLSSAWTRCRPEDRGSVFFQSIRIIKDS